MASCLLFHGPGARQASIDEAGRRGQLLHEPFGDNGLKVDEAREFAALLQSAPLGIACGIVVAGPMDQALSKAADALLKSIEQFTKYVQPMLWAYDLGGVQSTIRSRCLPIWSPATGLEPVDEELESVAQDLLAAALTGHGASVPVLMAKIKKSGREYDLIAEVADAMLGRIEDPKVLLLWERLRKVAMWRNPTPIEIMSVFLSGSG